MIRVLVVDDHPFFRGCLVDLINGSGDAAVVGECGDGTQVVAAVDELRPDVVVMDVRMPHMSGLDAAAALNRRNAAARVLMLTSETSDSSQAAARAHGAAGYLLKGSDPRLVLDAIRRAVLDVAPYPETGSHAATE